MIRVKIDTALIKDWESFHKVFATTLGFPDFYGKNMNAWIDCMTSLDCPEDGMTSVHVGLGEVLVLELDSIDDFIKRCPEQYGAIVECSSFVNYRRIEQGSSAVLALSFFKAN